MRELPALLADTLRPLQDQRASQNQRLATYKETSDQLADHAILDLYRREVIGVQAIGHVSKTFDELPHDWGDRTACRLFNAPTYALAAKVAEWPDLTKQLHNVIDGVAVSLEYQHWCINLVSNGLAQTASGQHRHPRQVISNPGATGVATSFDHLIGLGEYRGRNYKPELLRF